MDMQKKETQLALNLLCILIGQSFNLFVFLFGPFHLGVPGCISPAVQTIFLEYGM